MSSTVEEHVLYQIANAQVRQYPYAHIYVENIFPRDYYAALRANWPDQSALISLADTGLFLQKLDRFIKFSSEQVGIFHYVVDRPLLLEVRNESISTF